MPDPPQRNMNAPMPNRSFNRPNGPVREFDNPKRVNTTSLSESIGSNDVPFNQGTKKIPAPVGVDDILNELSSNTEDLSSIISSGKRDTKSTSSRKKKKRPTRSINLNI